MLAHGDLGAHLSEAELDELARITGTLLGALGDRDPHCPPRAGYRPWRRYRMFRRTTGHPATTP
jgi:hypothetical protein